jgi:hypothetical protein
MSHNVNSAAVINSGFLKKIDALIAENDSLKDELKEYRKQVIVDEILIGGEYVRIDKEFTDDDKRRVVIVECISGCAVCMRIGLSLRITDVERFKADYVALPITEMVIENENS